MTRARLRALAAVLILIGLSAFAVWSHQLRRAEPAERAPMNKPTLLLLTSLPLMFGEQFSIDQPGSPVLKALQAHFRVVPISTASAAELKRGQLLLMAQPLAQRPEDLLALDDWVRRGGRVLLLADPLLEWPSERPLGDPLRAAPMFADTGLLGHWGLRLDAPDQRGPRTASVGGTTVMTASPGTLVRLKPGCAVAADGLVARCSLGKGRATIIADADLLNVAGEEALDGPTAQNLDSLLTELAAMQRP